MVDELCQRVCGLLRLAGRNSLLLHGWQMDRRAGAARGQLVAKLRRVDASQVRSTC